MSSKIFLLSDIHFGIRQNSVDWLKIHKDYFENFFIPNIKSKYQKGDILFILGDIFDNRNNVNVLIQNYVIKIFKKLQSILPVYILVGNHDIYFKHTNDINSIKILEPYVEKIFTKVNIFNFEGHSILIMPWVEELEDEKKLFETYNNKCDYVFAHTEFKGLKHNKYSTIENGIDITNDLNYERYFSGHIHTRQQTDKIVYTGNPFHMSRNDVNTKKGIYIFTPEDNKYEFIVNDHSPKYIRKSVTQIAEMTVEEFENTIRNNFVDIIIPMEMSSHLTYNNFHHFKNIAKLINLEIQDTYNLKIVDTEIDNEDINNFNIDTLLSDYINTQNFSTDKKTKILNKIKELKERTVLE